MLEHESELTHVYVFLKAVAVIVLFGAPAFAVCPQPHPRVCAEFFKSDAVFIGTVLAQRTVPAEGDFYDGWLYDLRVQRTFRGSARKTISVFTENSSGRFPLESGRQYLLFATKYKNRLEIDNCGNSGLLSQAEDTIRQIERIEKAPSGGEIDGRVVTQSAQGYLDTPIGGIRIVARGEKKTYETVTSQDGSFCIHVPAGKYTVHAESSHWTISPYDLSYDDPNQIIVHHGGCAQVQFLATPK